MSTFSICRNSLSAFVSRKLSETRREFHGHAESPGNALTLQTFCCETSHVTDLRKHTMTTTVTTTLAMTMPMMMTISFHRSVTKVTRC